MAVALAALDAVVVVLSLTGESRIPLVDFHRLPGHEPHRDTVLEHGQMIVAIELPPLASTARANGSWCPAEVLTSLPP